MQANTEGTAHPESRGLDAPFSETEYRDRWARVRREMRARGLDTLVVWQRGGGSYDRASNVFWLSNFSSLASGQETPYVSGVIGKAYAALIFHGDRDPELHIAEPVDATDLSQLVVRSIAEHDNLPRGVARRVLELNGPGRVGYVGDDYLPILFWRHLVDESPQLEWEPHDVIMPVIQKVKTPEELAVYREMGAITTEAMDALMWGLIEGEPESVAAGRAAQIVTASGGGFQRISANHGKSPAIWSHGYYGNRPIAPRQGDLVRGWVYGPVRHGLWIDPGRTAVCGNKPTPEQKSLLNNTADLITELIDFIRPGRTPLEAGALADRIIADFGYAATGGPAPWALYGHNVGTFFIPPYIPAQVTPDSPPLATALSEEPFEADMVFTVEFFLDSENLGTSTFEEVFIIGEDRNEVITNTPLVFW